MEPRLKVNRTSCCISFAVIGGIA